MARGHLERIHTLAEELEQTTDKRDEYIRQAHREGSSLRDIARAAGVSHEKVRQIVKEEK